MYRKIKRGFTLIELIIVITILTIIALGTKNIDLLRLSNNQKINIFKNKVKINMEDVINNSLTGKAKIGLNVPKYRKIEINDNYNGSGLGTGNILIKFGSGTFQLDNGLTIKAKKFYTINNIKCNTLLLDNETSSNKVELELEDGNLKIINGCNNNQKIINFDLSYKGLKKEITINSVNNIINSN